MMNKGTNEVHGLLVGAGYFSDFHLDAWQRVGGASIVAICDLDEAKARAVADKFGITTVYSRLTDALEEDLDFVDIATGPEGRLEVVRQVLGRGLAVMCQKPLASSFDEAQQIIEAADASGLPFMVHDNFRFQPWYREIKRLLSQGVVGRRLQSIEMRMRMGDGWAEDAYLSRQPYFRSMPRLLVHETGVHFIDTLRFLAGEIVECSAKLQRLNPSIVGEDSGVLRFRFVNGATATWNGDRYHEALTEHPRYTFGEMTIDCDRGSLWLDLNGKITVKPLGKDAYTHDYLPSRVGFAGDCVRACQEHFVEVLNGRTECETSPKEYLKTLRVVEAAYQSARISRSVLLDSTEPSRSRIVDLSLPVSNELRGVEISAAKRLEVEGWNATTLSLYSHAGTHMDAPRHFLPNGSTLDQQALSTCIGMARVVNLAPIEPKQLITVDDVFRAIGQVFPGDRLLLRTDWYKRFGTTEYRDELPRISIDLAHWLVQKRVCLVGVEPPSVADVNNIDELTEVHQVLFRGGVLIVEGLANLDQLTESEVEFIALPLRILGGDGCPVRAVAVERPLQSYFEELP